MANKRKKKKKDKWTNKISIDLVFFFLLNKKKRVSSVDSSILCHVTAIGNTTCTTWALLGLSFEPLFFGCKTMTPTIKSHPMQ